MCALIIIVIFIEYCAFIMRTGYGVVEAAVPSCSIRVIGGGALWVDTWTRAKIQKRKTMVFIA